MSRNEHSHELAEQIEYDIERDHLSAGGQGVTIEVMPNIGSSRNKKPAEPAPLFCNKLLFTGIARWRLSVLAV